MREIVGVVGGVRDQSADSPADQLIYLPIADPQGRGVRRMTVVLRSSTDRRALLPQVRGVVAEIDPMLPLTDVREMTAVVSASMTRLSYTMSMVVAAALIATFLGAVGIYGLVGFAASRRIREIGIRRALGARTAEISRVVLGHSLGLALLGVTLGLGGGAALVRVTTSLLHGLRPLDPASFLGGSMFFLGVVLLASLPPLVRALRIDPAASVRLE